MPTSWGDSVPSTEAENVAAGNAPSTARPPRPVYVPPHLRNSRQVSNPSSTNVASTDFSSPPDSGSAFPQSRPAWGNRDGGGTGDRKSVVRERV